MRGFRPTVDDEMLLRVISGVATDPEREAVANWRRERPGHEHQYRELDRILAVLRESEAALEVPSPPSAGVLLARSLGRRHQQVPRVSRSRWLAWGGVAAASIAVALFGRNETDRSPRAEFGGALLATATGQSMSASLADGTAVTLAADSRIWTAERNGRREVWLHGRAEFTVAHHPERPFVVRTTAGDAFDRGTRFVARVAESRMQLAVFEGRVAVTNSAGFAEAGPGQMATMTSGKSPQVVRIGRAHSASDWLEAALVFEATPLEEVASVLASRYDMELRIPPALGSRTVSAWFTVEPTAQLAISSICRAVGAQCTIEDKVAVFSSGFEESSFRPGGKV